MSELVDFHHFIPHDEVRTARSSLDFSEIKFQVATMRIMTLASIFYSSLTYAKVKRRARRPLFSQSKQIDLDKFYVERGGKKNHLEMTSNTALTA